MYRFVPKSSSSGYTAGRHIGLALVALVFSLPTQARECEGVALVASLQGDVQYRVNSSADWQKVQVDQALCAGEQVRVAGYSRAALVLNNDTLVRLDQHTTLTLTGLSDNKDKTWIDLLKGIGHFISRVKQKFEVSTPFVNAAVEGTEFVVAVDDSQGAVSVFEGRVRVSNSQGELVLTNGQRAVAAKDQAPELKLLARPRDAVQWALYYPPVVDSAQLTALKKDSTVGQRLEQSLEAFEQGQSDQALRLLGQPGEDERYADLHLYRAGLLLSLGRVDEAESVLQGLQTRKQREADALALRSIIQIVTNRLDEAQHTHKQALQADEHSVAALLAASYYQQTRFNLATAMALTDKALQLQKDNALLWTRKAELLMSQGELTAAVSAAARAALLQPNYARIHDILGFAHLTRIQIESAQKAFDKAIVLDSADPLARLGLGLAMIRQGKLADGRRQLELAASLDPNNALIRSYLGKAYYQERRDKVAADQFAMAKELDPNDPTPWFYDAIRKQNNNNLIAALHDLEQAIARNDNRAVYRSRLLLDSDNASRSASQARVYNSLGLNERAQQVASRSLADDPLNHSAHRALAESYVDKPRHESARVSELLQAQLYAPVSRQQFSPQLGETSMNIASSELQSGLGEYSALFSANGVDTRAALWGGNFNTSGGELTVAGLYGPAALGAGYFKYGTDGFRDNADIAHEVINANAKVALPLNLTLDLFAVQRDTQQGTPQQSLLYNSAVLESRTLAASNYGVALSFDWGRNTKAIVLWQRTASDLDYRLNDAVYQFSLDESNTLNGESVQAQLISKGEKSYFIVGVEQVDNQQGDHQVITFGPDEMDLGNQKFNEGHQAAYLYWGYRPLPVLDVTLAGSYFVEDNEVLDYHQERFFPKLGLVWQPAAWVDFRLAYIETFKRYLSRMSSLEPTRVAGLNQLNDDGNGTVVQSRSLYVSVRPGTNLDVFMDLKSRSLEEPVLGQEGEGVVEASAIMENYNVGVRYALPGVGLLFFGANTTLIGNDLVNPVEYRLVEMPLQISFTPISSVAFQLVNTWVSQIIEYSPEWKGYIPGLSGVRSVEEFSTFDLKLSYVLTKIGGKFGLDVKNVFAEKFDYTGEDYFNADPYKVDVRYQPERSVLAYFWMTI